MDDFLNVISWLALSLAIVGAVGGAALFWVGVVALTIFGGGS